MPTFKVRRGIAHDWQVRNPVLADGEFGLEVDTGYYKIGNGRQRWVDLGYYRDWDATTALIQQKIDELSGAVSGVTLEQFDIHVDSTDPHPNYDDGANLVLLYENAKV